MTRAELRVLHGFARVCAVRRLRRLRRLGRLGRLHGGRRTTRKSSDLALRPLIILWVCILVIWNVCCRRCRYCCGCLFFLRFCSGGLCLAASGRFCSFFYAGGVFGGLTVK